MPSAIDPEGTCQDSRAQSFNAELVEQSIGPSVAQRGAAEVVRDVSLQRKLLLIEVALATCLCSRPSTLVRAPEHPSSQ